jgi:hypothetical protein
MRICTLALLAMRQPGLIPDTLPADKPAPPRKD